MKRFGLVALAITYTGLLVGVPLVFLMTRTFGHGLGAVVHALSQPDALRASRLSLEVAVVTVLTNTLFGLGAALALARRRSLLAHLITLSFDVPVAISPVIIGVALILAYSRIGWFGHDLAAWGITVLFSPLGIVLASMAVTLPYVLRSTLPVLIDGGEEQELAARTLGASRLRVLVSVTLPTIKWGLLYGVTMCTLRTMGEFGAVLVVSGNVTGVTQTMPIYIFDRWDQNFDAGGSFAGAFELALFSLVLLTLLATLRRKERLRLVTPT